MTHNLLTSCWLQPDNKLLEQTCNKAVEFIKLVASLLQACSNLSTSLGQPVRAHPVNKLLQQTCYKSSLLQVCYKLCVFTCVAFTLYTRKNGQLVNKLCSQQACNKLVNKFVAMLLFCQVVPSLWLTTCWQVVDLQHDNKLLEQTCNKAVEFIKLVASLLQACSNLSTSLGQPVRIHLVNKLVPTSLLQVCCRFVTSCAFLRV